MASIASSQGLSYQQIDISNRSYDIQLYHIISIPQLQEHPDASDPCYSLLFLVFQEHWLIWNFFANGACVHSSGHGCGSHLCRPSGGEDVGEGAARPGDASGADGRQTGGWCGPCTWVTWDGYGSDGPTWMGMINDDQLGDGHPTGW